MKKVLFAMMAVLVLAACGGQEVEKTKVSDEVKEEINQSEKEEKPKEEKKQEPAKIGDTLKVDGMKITLVSASVYKGEINQFEPLKNDHAIEVKVIVENTTKEKKFIDAMEFTMYDVDGFELTNALTEELPLSAEIPGGKKVKGSLFFDVPKQKGTWEIHYEDMTSINGEPAIWELKAK